MSHFSLQSLLLFLWFFFFFSLSLLLLLLLLLLLPLTPFAAPEMAESEDGSRGVQHFQSAPAAAIARHREESGATRVVQPICCHES